MQWGYSVRLDTPIGPGWITVHGFRDGDVIFDYIPEGPELTYPIKLGRCKVDDAPKT